MVVSQHVCKYLRIQKTKRATKAKMLLCKDILLTINVEKKQSAPGNAFNREQQQI